MKIVTCTWATDCQTDDYSRASTLIVHIEIVVINIYLSGRCRISFFLSCIKQLADTEANIFYSTPSFYLKIISIALTG
jgi:hypothetical protein